VAAGERLTWRTGPDIPWPHVATRLTQALAGRLVVVANADRHATLRKHLPRCRPHAVTSITDLWEQAWPAPDPAPPDQPETPQAPEVPELRFGAVFEAYSTACMLPLLLSSGTWLGDDNTPPDDTRTAA